MGGGGTTEGGAFAGAVLAALGLLAKANAGLAPATRPQFHVGFVGLRRGGGG